MDKYESTFITWNKVALLYQEMFGFQTASTGDESYVYYYRENDIAGLLEENNFATIECIQKKYPDHDDNNKQVHAIFIAKKIPVDGPG